MTNIENLKTISSKNEAREKGKIGGIKVGEKPMEKFNLSNSNNFSIFVNSAKL